MTENNEPKTLDGSMSVLRHNRGQTYMTAEFAADLMYPFTEFVTDDFIVEHTLFGERELQQVERVEVAAHALFERLETAQDSVSGTDGTARGDPHEMVVLYAKVSAILVGALGGEPSDHVAGGHGFTFDGRHEENVEILEELVSENIGA